MDKNYASWTVSVKNIISLWGIVNGIEIKSIIDQDAITKFENRNMEARLILTLSVTESMLKA